jgi:long-chain acyl-CoA synthetase
MAIWTYHPNIPSQFDIPNKDVIDIFYEIADNNLQNPFLIFEGNTLTYKETLEKVNRLANGLLSLGIKKGDRVAILLPNSPQFVISFLAILSIGATATAISPLYREKEIKHQLVDSGSKIVITLDMFVDRIRNIRTETNLEHVIVSSVADELGFIKGLAYRYIIGRKNPKKNSDEISYRKLLKESSPKKPNKPIDNPSEDIAVLQYTGGTTGVPKGAMLTHKNLVSQMITLHYWEEWLGGPPDGGVQRCNIGVLPFSHIFGLTTSFLWPLYSEAKIVLIPDARKLVDIMENIEKYEVHYMNGVPLLFQKLNDHPKIDNYDFSSLRMCISGGSSLHVDTFHTFEEKTGAMLIEGYGLSESAPVTHINPAVTGLRKNNIGIPIPNTEAKCVCLETEEDLDHFNDEGYTKAGELNIKGPQVMKGYWNRPEETADILSPDGWLRTGDVAKMDNEGYFTIVDRLKDVIFTSGYQVWPLEVEKALCLHPAITMAAVIPIKDENKNELIKAIAVLAEGEEQPSIEELRKFCKQHLAPYKVPKFFEFREELPTSAVGKILRRPLREEAANKKVPIKAST